jgi:hypothetical protein
MSSEREEGTLVGWVRSFVLSSELLIIYYCKRPWLPSQLGNERERVMHCMLAGTAVAHQGHGAPRLRRARRPTAAELRRQADGVSGPVRRGRGQHVGKPPTADEPGTPSLRVWFGRPSCAAVWTWFLMKVFTDRQALGGRRLYRGDRRTRCC